MKYWHTVFSILSLLIFSHNASSQNRLRFGPEVALAVNFYPKTDLGSNALLSSHLGIKTTYALKKHFSIYTGIYYTQKKIQYTSSYTEPTPSLDNILALLGSVQSLPFDPTKAFNTDSKVTLNGLATAQFIEIPLLCSYEHEGIVLFAGPYIGFLASIKDKQVKETNVPFVESVNYNEIAGGLGGGILTALSPPAYSKTTTTSTSTRDFNKIDFGFTIGMGYQFKHININATYSNGLLDYRDNANLSDKKISYKTLRFSIVYLFDLNHKKSQRAPKSPGGRD